MVLKRKYFGICVTVLNLALENPTEVGTLYTCQLTVACAHEDKRERHRCEDSQYRLRHVRQAASE